MSIHIVDVCPRCGNRNMSPPITVPNAPKFAAVLTEIVVADAFLDEIGKAGCQNCDPEKVERQSAADGRLRAIWDGSTTP